MNVILSAVAALMLTGASTQPPDYKPPADILAESAPGDWVPADEENVLVMDLPSGTIYIEMRPDMAPLHVERVKTLTRAGFYNGVLFHRVIDGFMAQGGDPTATGQGGSDLPDLAPEFAMELKDAINAHVIGRDDRAAQVGFIGTVPVGTQAPTLPSFLSANTVALWGLHCKGVLSMARATQPNSANSQFFLMFGDNRDGLDQGYTVWGKVMAGYKNARRISRGEPPIRPTPIVRMRILADLPQDEKVKVEYLDTTTKTFDEYLIADLKVTENGYVRDMCAIDVPVRINGEVTK